MSEPTRHLTGVPEKRPTEVFHDITEGLRIRSSDYGTGTVVAVLSIGVQVYWDNPLKGTAGTHLLVHDKVYVARLERI